MPYSLDELSDHQELFKVRTREVKVRLQTLESDLQVVQHPLSRAIVLRELNKVVDDYVERRAVFE